MGRAKLSFKSKKAMQTWQKKKSDPRWNDIKSYDPKKRLWVKMLGGGVAMVDSEKFIDHEGEELYRLVHMVSASGSPSIQYGAIRVFYENMLRVDKSPVIDEETSVKLDKWLKSAKENVKVICDNGWVDVTCKIKPCTIKIPDHFPWISKQQARDNMMKNLFMAINL